MGQPPQDRPPPPRLGGNGPLPAQDDPRPGEDGPCRPTPCGATPCRATPCWAGPLACARSAAGRTGQRPWSCGAGGPGAGTSAPGRDLRGPCRGRAGFLMPAPVRRAAGIPHAASPAPGLISGRVVPADWIGAHVGAAAAVAERDALGTSVRVAAWPPDGLAAALAAVDAELDRLDRQASRFRAGSELSRIHRVRPRSSAERRSGRGDPRRAHRRAMDSWRDRSDGRRRAHRARI